MTDPLVESKIEEAAHAAAVAHEATSNARGAQMHTAFVSALREVLTDDSPNGWLLLQRVPIICNDIKWIKRAVMAIFAGIGMLFIAFVSKAFGI